MRNQTSPSHEKLRMTPEIEGVARWRRDLVKRASYKLQRETYEHAWDVEPATVPAEQTAEIIDLDRERLTRRSGAVATEHSQAHAADTLDPTVIRQQVHQIREESQAGGDHAQRAA